MMDRVVRLGRRLGGQISQTVPPGLAVCEFECREPTCTWAKGRECRRRWQIGSGDPSAPTSRCWSDGRTMMNEPKQ